MNPSALRCKEAISLAGRPPPNVSARPPSSPSESSEGTATAAMPVLRCRGDLAWRPPLSPFPTVRDGGPCDGSRGATSEAARRQPREPPARLSIVLEDANDPTVVIMDDAPRPPARQAIDPGCRVDRAAPYCSQGESSVLTPEV